MTHEHLTPQGDLPLNRSMANEQNEQPPGGEASNNVPQNIEEAQVRRIVEQIRREELQQASDIPADGPERPPVEGPVPAGGDGPQEPGQNVENEPGEPWKNDILEKLTNFYRHHNLLKLTEAQASARAAEDVRTNNLPHDELFNTIGFIQEIVEGRINAITSDTQLSQAQKDERKADLIRSFSGKGDLNQLIGLIMAPQAPIQQAKGSRRQIPVFESTDLDEALEDAAQADVEKVKGILDSKIFNPLHRRRDIYRSEARGINQYKSINEIAIDAMIQTGGDFGRGGKFAIVKTENGKEVFQQDNFLGWIRNRMMEFHETDVDNQLDMFSGVYVAGGTRNVPVGEMFRVEAMFTDIENGYLNVMRDQVYMETWLFMKSRNYDADYRKVMGNDADLPKILQKFYYDNTFTKEGTLDRALTLPGIGSGKEIKFDSREAMRESNQDTGRALRLALLTYYHITDMEMLNKIEEQLVDETGKSEQQIADEKESIHFKSTLFDNEAFIRSYIKKERVGGSEKDEEELIKAAKEKIKATAHLFDASGKLKPGEETMGAYMTAFNPFDSANKDFDQKNEAKERVRMFIMEKTGISYQEAVYAETFAFSMARWTGLAARHDLRASAYDSWTKVLETERYRSRQTNENQGGIHGNPYSLAGFKRMGVDFLAGAKALRDEDGIEKSILEIIQGGQGDEVDLGKLREIKFGDRVMEKFGTDHIQRAFALYEDIIETHEFRFDKIAHVEPGSGRIIFDPKAANEWVDKFLKAMRYAYRTWPGTDYSKLIRVRDKNNDIETADIAHSMWGRQVYKDFVDGIDERGTVKEKKGLARRGTVTEVIDGKEATREQTDGEVIQEYRQEFWKRPLMYAIAAEIQAHRDYDSGMDKYRFNQLMTIYQWLENFNGDLSYDEDDLKNSKRDPSKMFFSKQDMEWVRKASDTKTGRLLFEEGMSVGTLGLLEGAGKGVKVFLKGLGLTG